MTSNIEMITALFSPSLAISSQVVGNCKFIIYVVPLRWKDVSSKNLFNSILDHVVGVLVINYVRKNISNISA